MNKKYFRRNIAPQTSRFNKRKGKTISFAIKTYGKSLYINKDNVMEDILYKERCILYRELNSRDKIIEI